MRVLLTGGTGQLGRALIATVPDGIDVISPTRALMDLADPMLLTGALDGIRPDAVINAAAYTNVDAAEADREGALTVNATAPGVIAKWCHAHRIRLIHISTDFVFDGDGSVPLLPSDPVSPVNVYGQTKAEGEHRVLAEDPDAVILRTSWLYGPGADTGFVNSMLKRAQSMHRLQAVFDQTGSPTSAMELAYIVWAVLPQMGGAGGIYHAACQGSASRFELVQAIVDTAGKEGYPIVCELVEPVPSNTFPTPAARPTYSALDTKSLTERFNVTPADWRSALKRHVTSLSFEAGQR